MLGLGCLTPLSTIFQSYLGGDKVFPVTISAYNLLKHDLRTKLILHKFIYDYNYYLLAMLFSSYINISYIHISYININNSYINVSYINISYINISYNNINYININYINY